MPETGLLLRDRPSPRHWVQSFERLDLALRRSIEYDQRLVRSGYRSAKAGYTSATFYRQLGGQFRDLEGGNKVRLQSMFGPNAAAFAASVPMPTAQWPVFRRHDPLQSEKSACRRLSRPASSSTPGCVSPRLPQEPTFHRDIRGKVFRSAGHRRNSRSR